VGDSDEADGSNPAELRGAGLVQRQKAVADQQVDGQEKKSPAPRPAIPPTTNPVWSHSADSLTCREREKRLRLQISRIRPRLSTSSLLIR
jgi:hypothetical protein